MTPFPLVLRGLELYDLADARFTPLGGSDNLNYRIDALSGSYALHLHISPHHTQESLLAEMTWLGELSLDTTVAVPEPVPSSRGALVETVKADDGKTVPCTLTVWVEGKVPPTIDFMTDAQLEQVGALMARLQTHSQRFSPSLQAEYRTYAAPYYRDRLRTLVPVLESSVTEDKLTRFRLAAEAIFTRLDGMAHEQKSFGIIHGDFHSGNYLVHGDEIRLIDFNRCGLGFYLFDLSLALMELEEPRRGTILHGYETVSPLPLGYHELNRVFLALAYLDNLGTLAANPNEWEFIRGDSSLLFGAFQEATELDSF